MATRKISDYSIGDSNIDGVMETLDGTYKGVDRVTFSEITTTNAPKVKVGSVIEVNGARYIIETADESISTTDPYTAATVSDGGVYVVTQISGGVLSFSFTATPPTWDDEKQGWYKSGTTDKYLPLHCISSSTATVFNKVQTDNKIIPYTDLIIGEDVTERSTASSALDSNLQIDIPYIAGQLWQVEMLFEGRGSGIALNTIFLTDNFSPGYQPVDIYAMMRGHYTDGTTYNYTDTSSSIASNYAGFIGSTYAKMTYTAYVYSTTSKLISLRLYVVPSAGTTYYKNRVLIARRVGGTNEA